MSQGRQKALELSSLSVAGPVVMSIGVFDGVHRGHQHLLAQVRKRAGELGATPVALTFEPHPQAILGRDDRWSYLTNLAERATLIGQLGVVCSYLRFDTALAGTPADEFMRLVRRRVSLRELWVGPDFALGSDRQGDTTVLAELGRRDGYGVRVSPPFVLNGQTVSSTSIRRLLGEGNLPLATDLLGYHFELSGPVVQGDQRGRKLGFPTANLGYDERRTLPADGIYAILVTVCPPVEAGQPGVGGPVGRWPGVVSIGVRPTFGGGRRTIESHLIGFDGDLYGSVITLQFVARLRPELKFAGPAELIEQMTRDVADAEARLATVTVPPARLAAC